MKKTITLMLGIYFSVNLLSAQNLVTNPGFENDPTTYTVVESYKNVLRRVANIKDETTQTAIPTSTADDISAGGIVAEESDRYAVGLDNVQENLPDIIAYLQNETNLTRKTML